MPEQAAQFAKFLADFRDKNSAMVDTDPLEAIEKFLFGLSGESPDPERPIDEFLRGVIEDAQALGSALELKMTSDLEESELRVLPALGHLLRHLLTELVHLRLVHLSKGEKTIDWKISASREDDRLEIRLSGLSKGNRTSALDRVRMQSSLEFLEDLEGNVRTEKTALILSLSVAGLRSEACCVIQSPDGRFCLQADKVQSSAGDGSKPGTELLVSGESGETRLRVDAIAPTQEMLVVESDEELAEEGILGFALSFAHSERIPLLDPDSI
jgi:hypothetical protein